jgi:hypothetical protein
LFFCVDVPARQKHKVLSDAIEFVDGDRVCIRNETGRKHAGHLAGLEEAYSNGGGGRARYTVTLYSTHVARPRTTQWPIGVIQASKEEHRCKHNKAYRHAVSKTEANIPYHRPTT